MRAFFRGWKRNLGVVTLLLACVVMAGWIRSLEITDFVATDCQTATYRLGSFGGMLSFIRDTPAGEFGRVLHLDSWKDDRQTQWTKWTPRHGDELEWRWDCGPFHFGAGKINDVRKGKITREESWTFPYWFFVLPPGLLSAWLLLSNPRSTKVSESPIGTATDAN